MPGGDKCDKKREYKYRAAFLVGVAGMSALFGFSRTLATAKKNDVQYFNKGIGATTIEMTETGAQLAMRALGFGTILAIFGTSSLCFGIYKLSGAKNFEEFRIICGNVLPKIPRNEVPRSRTEFENLSDLMNYLTTWKK